MALNEGALTTESDFDAGGQPGDGPDSTQATDAGSQALDSGQSDGDSTTTEGARSAEGSGDTSLTEEATFFDPKTLEEHPELMPVYKSLQSAYTKKNMAVTDKEKTLDGMMQLQDAFNKDPQGTVKAIAEQMGMQIVSPGSQVQANGNNPAPFQEGWEPQTWGDIPDALKPMIQQAIDQAVAPLNQELTTLRTSRIENTLDEVTPVWREHEAEVMNLLRAAPVLAKSPEQLLRAALPPAVFEKQAMQQAMKKLKGQGESANVSGASTTTRQPSNNAAQPKNFAEAVMAAKKAMGA